MDVAREMELWIAETRLDSKRGFDAYRDRDSKHKLLHASESVLQQPQLPGHTRAHMSSCRYFGGPEVELRGQKTT